MHDRQKRNRKKGTPREENIIYNNVHHVSSAKKYLSTKGNFLLTNKGWVW